MREFLCPAAYAVVDALLLLQRRRGGDMGTLDVSGREVEDQTIALTYTGGWWGEAPAGMPHELLGQTREVRALWLWLADHDGASTAALADQYGRTENATSKLLHRLEETELVDQIGRPSPGKPVCWQVVREQRSFYDHVPRVLRERRCIRGVRVQSVTDATPDTHATPTT